MFECIKEISSKHKHFKGCSMNFSVNLLLYLFTFLLIHLSFAHLICILLQCANEGAVIQRV